MDLATGPGKTGDGLGTGPGRAAHGGGVGFWGGGWRPASYVCPPSLSPSKPAENLPARTLWMIELFGDSEKLWIRSRFETVFEHGNLM